MESHAYPQSSRTKNIHKPKKVKRPPNFTVQKDFYRAAAAIANPDFADLSSEERKIIRQVVSTKLNKDAHESQD